MRDQIELTEKEERRRAWDARRKNEQERDRRRAQRFQERKPRRSWRDDEEDWK